MSTTFAVLKPGYKFTGPYKYQDGAVEIAFRGTYTQWTNELAPLLADDTPVYPLDNDCSDIKTIADLKKIIKEQ